MEERASRNSTPQAAAEAEQPEAERCYASLGASSGVAFDPTKDLNLPASYDEVQKRLNRLQGDRATDALN